MAGWTLGEENTCRSLVPFTGLTVGSQTSQEPAEDVWGYSLWPCWPVSPPVMGRVLERNPWPSVHPRGQDRFYPSGFRRHREIKPQRVG